MRPEDNPVVNESLKIGHSTVEVGIISPNSYLGGAVEIVAALNDGHIVSIMGDRRYDFDTVGVRFLGDTAWLPYGAFHIAATVGCPLVVLLTMKSSTHRYVVDASHVLRPTYENRSRRKEELQEWVQEYASILESFLIEHPYQCFLFQDIWGTTTPPAA
jgi:predicted LPLAT superfamily acyltransferase